MDHDFEEACSWITNEHPSLLLKKWIDGSWSIEQEVWREMNGEWQGEMLCWKERGLTTVARFYNTSCHVDFVRREVAKRDPKKSHWEGNFYHDGYLESKRIEEEREEQIKVQQESARHQWEIVKRSPIMERMTKQLNDGNIAGAYNELRPETMLKHSLKENKKETLAMIKRGGIEE
jgi:hypothetical protein